MPRRPPLLRCASLALVSALVLGCGDDTDEIAEAGDARAEQARTAALDAGLDDEVADFLAMAARGETATYEVRYPGPTDGTDLVVTSRPPDRRVQVEADGAPTEVRLVAGGEAYECLPGDDTGDSGDGREGGLVCERTDALVEPPGVFSDTALDRLGAALADRADDYTFEVETAPVAGVEARCLVTRLRDGREAPELGRQGTLCVSPEGALLLVDQGSERLEATGYTTDVDDGAFVRPDLDGSGGRD